MKCGDEKMMAGSTKNAAEKFELEFNLLKELPSDFPRDLPPITPFAEAFFKNRMELPENPRQESRSQPCGNSDDALNESGELKI